MTTNLFPPRLHFWMIVPIALIAAALLAGCGGGAESGVVIAIVPYTATVPEGGTLTFTANVANGSSLDATFSVQEGTAGGTITSAGVYTAPETVGTFHVVATSVADPTKTATATVTVTAPTS